MASVLLCQFISTIYGTIGGLGGQHKCVSYSVSESQREMNRFPQIFYSKQRLHSKFRWIIIGFWHKENMFTNSESIMQKKRGSHSDLLSSIPNFYLLLCFRKCHMPCLSSVSWIACVYLVLILP